MGALMSTLWPRSIGTVSAELWMSLALPVPWGPPVPSSGHADEGQQSLNDCSASGQHTGWEKGPVSVKMKKILCQVGELESGGFCLPVFPSRLPRPFLQKFCSHSSFISQHSSSPVGGRLFPSHDKLFSVRIQICLFKSDHLWWIYSVNMSLNRSNRG